jgi:hypothetical protein
VRKAYVKHTFRLEAGLSRQLGERAASRKVSKTEIVEAALASLLSPDDEQRMEAVIARRLDRIARQLQRMEWQGELSGETIGLFIRFWLTTNPPLPDSSLKAAQATGKKRWHVFVEALTRRMSLGPKLGEEINQSAADPGKGSSEFPDDHELPK